MTLLVASPVVATERILDLEGAFVNAAQAVRARGNGKITIETANRTVDADHAFRGADAARCDSWARL